MEVASFLVQQSTYLCSSLIFVNLNSQNKTLKVAIDQHS